MTCASRRVRQIGVEDLPEREPVGHAEHAERAYEKVQVDGADAGPEHAFFHAALERGVYLPPSPYEVLFLSLAHDEATLSEAADVLVAAAEEAERV